MAQKYFGKNIPVASGFDLSAQGPLDARTVVTRYADLDTIPDIQKYAGLKVYVEEQKKYYFWDGTTWKEEVSQGPKGEQGPQGPAGEDGAIGPQGPAGAKGETGERGPQGPAGKDGEAGPQGPAGAKGETGEQGPAGAKGDQGERGPQGIQGPKGDPGEAFSIAKTFVSVDAMNKGFASDGVKAGQFVMIDTGNVEDPDNAKLYVKGAEAYSYITDLSGATGMKGPKGDQGEQGPAGKDGAAGPQGPAGPKGEQGLQGPAGADGKDGDNVRVGADYASAKQVKLFLKVIE